MNPTVNPKVEGEPKWYFTTCQLRGFQEKFNDEHILIYGDSGLGISDSTGIHGWLIWHVKSGVPLDWNGWEHPHQAAEALIKLVGILPEWDWSREWSDMEKDPLLGKVKEVVRDI